MTRVFSLNCYTDDPRFGGLAELGDMRDIRGYSLQKQLLLAGNPNLRLSDLDDLTKRCCPIRVRYIPGKQATDYPCIGLEAPAFSLRAFTRLAHLLEPAGEVLPLECKEGRFVGFRPSIFSDALCEEKSEIVWLDQDRGIADEINRFEFYPERVRDLVIFRLPIDIFGVYVTEPFVECVEREKLRGFVFKEVRRG